MATKEVKDLKKGNKIIIDGEVCEVKNIEKSKVAKHGKAKCRISAISANGKEKIIIRLEKDLIEIE